MAARILLAGAGADTAVALRPCLPASHYTLERALTAEDAEAVASKAEPDVVIAVDGRIAADSLVRRLKARLPDLPMVVLIPPLTEADRRLALLEAGADDVLSLPVSAAHLAAAVRCLRRQSDHAREIRRQSATAAEFGFAEPSPSFHQPARVTFVHTESDPPTAPLSRTGEVLNEADALALARGGRAAEVYVVRAARRSAQEGLAILSELRAIEAARRSALIVIAEDTATAATALEYGAAAVLPESASPAEIALRIDRAANLVRAARQLSRVLDTELQMAVTDELTGLRNRRYAQRHAERMIDEAAEAARPIAVMMADIDFFKRVNDHYGHPSGDRVLIEVAARLASRLRSDDLLARVGGEEFLLVLQNAGSDAATVAARRLCDAVSATPVELPDGTALPVTISIGISASSDDGPRKGDLEPMVRAADAALYCAKSAGRNRATLHAPECAA